MVIGSVHSTRSLRQPLLLATDLSTVYAWRVIRAGIDFCLQIRETNDLPSTLRFSAETLFT
jgi:hypothetical protein